MKHLSRMDIEEIAEKYIMILSILVYTFFSRMFDLCCLQ